jgi:hypothetical protein
MNASHLPDVYAALVQKASTLLRDHGLMDEAVHVKARALSTTEAIGNPEADDYPIQKGKERLMQADIRGAVGQAFTDHFADYAGTLAGILATPLTSNYRRAVFVSALNAALRLLGRIDGTVHCRDDEPVQCAAALGEHIFNRHGRVKIALVGLQPRMLECLGARFPLRVLDMDADNIDKKKFGVVIEHPDNTAAAVDWADVLLVTGTTIVNGTLPAFVGDKPVIFYGTTIAGAAHLMGWERYCAKST